jgi:hypothetical protein
VPDPDWSKLTIDLAEVDAGRLLGFWGWLVDRPMRPLVLTRFGDWFLADEAGAVHRLDILEGTFAKVCDSVAEMEARRSGEDELVDWFLGGMVYALYEAGLVPQRGEGFGYAVAPVLGGPLERENVVLVDASAWQLFMAQLHDKLRAVPPGARIVGIDVSDSGELTIEVEPQ